MNEKLITLERTCYSHNDDCAEIRHKNIQKRLDRENKSLNQKIKEIFQEIGVDLDLDSMIEKGQ